MHLFLCQFLVLHRLFLILPLFFLLFKSADHTVREAFEALEAVRKNPPKCSNPLNVGIWARYLKLHPSGKQLLEYIRNGWPLGVKITREQIKNLYRKPSHWASSIPEIHEMCRVQVKETTAGYLIPTDLPPLYNISLFCVPKKDDDGIFSLYRMVRHGSFCDSSSLDINRFIEPQHYKLRDLPNLIIYVKKLLGKRFFALSDLKDAFRQLLMAKKDRRFCGYTLFGKHWLDTRQPYGLASAAHNCQEFALLIIWIMEHYKLPKELRDAMLVHIDDFIMASTYKEGVEYMETAFDLLLEELGVKQSDKKAVHCTSKGVCYGFYFDLEAQTVGIPNDKLNNLRAGIAMIIRHRLCTARALESVCGKIMHWTQLQKAAKPLCYSLIHHIQQYVRSAKVRKTDILALPIRIINDLKMWLHFCDFLQSVPFQYIAGTPSIDVYAATDASSTAGGMVMGAEWAKYDFSPKHSEWHINVKEAHALLMLIHNRRQQLHGRRLVVYIDNKTVFYAFCR